MEAIPNTIWQIMYEAWNVLREMAPYLLFGFLIAGLLSVVVKQGFVEKHLGDSKLLPVLKAAVFGVPLPLCSCGVIPVAASLRRQGASRGATGSFLISTPQTGVDSVLVTLSLLGPVFAVVRPLAALLTGIFGGMLINLGARTGDASDPAQAAEARGSDGCGGGCALPSEEEGKAAKLAEALKYGFGALPQDIGKALMAGLLVAGIISALTPDDFFAGLMGGGILAMLVMMLVGMPLYVCATASVPIAAALIAKGVSPGAALVFLMTGPATNAATFTTIWKIMGKRATAIYMATVAGGAIATGFLVDYIFKVTAATPGVPEHWSLPGPVKTAGAVALLAVLAVAMFRLHYGGEKEMAAGENESAVLLKVDGMTCNHCVGAVKRALEQTPGVKEAEVDLKSGRALVSGDEIEAQVLVDKIKQLGYDARAME